jgi:tetratricopeptide (TPR) repeat protein
MKVLFALFLGFFFFFSALGQEDQIKKLVSEGVELNDQGKYDEAIAKYKEALDIDKNSTLANYELAYTYLASGQYENAIKFSKRVIDQDSDNQLGAYVTLGTSFDMLGKPDKAMKAYEEGIEKFPESNLLYYNLAITALNQKDYEKAEQSATNAIKYKPQHCSSHIIILAVTMQDQKKRVKSILPLFYSLMLEPTSNRAKSNYPTLLILLNQGVERKSEKNINISVPNFADADSVYSPVELMLSLSAASKLTDTSKSEMENFVETTRSLFSIMGELKKENKDIWWDFYVPRFNDLIQTENYEAFCYYISQSANKEEVTTWIKDHPEKMEKFGTWLKNL